MELVLILVVALLVLGPKRMPDLARTLGRGLGEFRRASNDLRQSLALDDLQSDLRKGLSGQGTTEKPDKESALDEDRPAQAGDDLAPGSAGEAEESSGPAAAASEGEADESVSENAAKAHPGELPLDQDPHDHRDDVSPEASDVKPTPADSELGNIPVGGGSASKPAPAGSTGDKRG